MSVEVPKLSVWCVAVVSVCLASSVVLSCGSDSSTASDQLPAAPCAGSNALVLGRIEDVGQSCVSVRVERVVSRGEPIYSSRGSVIFSGNPSRGSLVRGHLGSVYAWQHEFEDGAHVAFFVEARGEELTLQLFPLEDDQVQVQWGRRELQLEVTEMMGPDCADKLEMLRESSSEEIEGGSDSNDTQSPDTALCAPR